MVHRGLTDAGSLTTNRFNPPPELQGQPIRVAIVANVTYISYKTLTTGRQEMKPTLCVLLGILLVPTVGFVGDIVTDGKFKSTLTGSAPLEVATSKKVISLHADMLDGLHGTDFYKKSEVDALVAAAIESAGAKRFLLTSATHLGDEVLGACPEGFHMANMFEISQPSELRYAFDHASAEVRPDSAQGPPTQSPGWIRTGYEPSNSPSNPGAANCGVWTSDSPSFYGTAVWISVYWADPSEGIYVPVPGTPWTSETFACSNYISVWCVED